MVRKRCKHALGLTGRAKLKAWRACDCAWGVDLYIRGVRTWHNLGTDETDAKIAELRLRADIAEHRTVRRRPGDTVEEVLDAWLTHKIATGAKVSSIANYKATKKRLDEYYRAAAVDVITTDTVRRMADDFRDNGFAPRTINGWIAFMSGAWKHARRNGLKVPAIVFADAVQSVPASEHPWLMTIPECKRLIATCDDPGLRTAMEFALLTGIRRGELLAITSTDVDLTRNVLHIRRTVNIQGGTNTPKTANGMRAVRLSPRATDIARERIDHVGEGHRLWPYTLNQITGQLTRHMKVNGLHCEKRGWHAFRHAHTAILDEAGVSIRDAAARLGHGPNFSQTNSYGWATEHTDVGAIDNVLTGHD